MLKGKYILKGKINLLSPMLIGNGVEENTDNDGKIIISKRKILNVDIEIEYFIPKKTKNNNYNDSSFGGGTKQSPYTALAKVRH